MSEELSPQVYFIRYAFPCSHVLLKVRKEISLEDYEKMKNASINKENLPKEYLEKVFFRAFGRIENIAKELGKEKWDRSVIKEYFRIRHNSVLEKLDYPEAFKEQCRIHIGEIKSINKDEAIVEYTNVHNKIKKRKINTSFLQDAKIGDKVTIHYSYAVEKL